MKVRNIYHEELTWIYGGFKKEETKMATGKWKEDITKLARDFYVDPKVIIKYVEGCAKGNESDLILYERAHRKMMAMAFK